MYSDPSLPSIEGEKATMEIHAAVAIYRIALDMYAQMSYISLYVLMSSLTF